MFSLVEKINCAIKIKTFPSNFNGNFASHWKFVFANVVLFARLFHTSRHYFFKRETINYGLGWTKSTENLFSRKRRKKTFPSTVQTCLTTSQLTVASSIIISYLINTLYLPGVSLRDAFFKQFDYDFGVSSWPRAHAAIKRNVLCLFRIMFPEEPSMLIKHFY